MSEVRMPGGCLFSLQSFLVVVNSSLGRSSFWDTRYLSRRS